MIYSLRFIIFGQGNCVGMVVKLHGKGMITNMIYAQGIYTYVLYHKNITKYKCIPLKCASL